MKKVSIIIVTYNSGKFIQACLRSVLQQTYQDFEIIVVDNASTDSTVATIQHRAVETGHDLSLQIMERNKGFSIGCNVGVKKATGDYLALLNPDTEVDKNWLSELVKTLEQDEQAGIAVSKIYLGKSKYLDSAGSLYNNILNAWSRGVWEQDTGQYDKQEEVPMATACACLFRKEILNVTYLFDPDFFMYLEELDFCLRVRNLGYRIIYQPKSIACHFKSQSVLQQDLRQVYFKQYHGNINRAKLLGKYLSFGEFGKNSHLIASSYLYWYWYFLIHGRWWKVLKMFFLVPYYYLKGILQRSDLEKQKTWQKYLRQVSLHDLIQLKKELEYKQTLYEQTK